MESVYFMKGIFRIVKPMLVGGAKALRRETLKTGAKIMTDLAED
jgi:hypothetical protein